MDTQVNMTPSS